MQKIAVFKPSAQGNAIPATIAPALNRSGSLTNKLLAIAPPADNV
jgi:hypothetical protein